MPVCRALIVFLIFTTATAFAQRRREQNLEPWVKGALKTQDVNSDGVVTKDEAKGLLKSNFARVDADSDGKVTPDELQVVAKQIRGKRNRTNQQKKGDQRSAKVPDNVELKTDIAYRPDHKRQTLDLMLPKEKSEQPRPALVIIHGGGWRGGDKGGGMWRSLPLQYAARGYVCISVNYRLTPDGVDIFDCIEDCRCAVRWLRANAEKYNVDPAEFVVPTEDGPQRFAAEVVFVSPEIRFTEQTFDVWVEVQNSENKLLPGMKGNLVINVSEEPLQ